MRPEIIDRAQGVLYGQFIGYSLGALVEFRKPEEISGRYPDGVHELVDGGVWNIAAGQPTDDSEMALALARRIVTDGGYERDRVFRAYKDWYESGPFDCGNTIGQALASNGASLNEHSQANGAMMRVSPIAVAYWPDPLRAGRAAAEDATLTHPNQVCVNYNRAYATALAEVVGGRDGAEAFEAHLGT